MAVFATAQELYDALSAPFQSDEIDWRVGSTTQDKSKGMALAYVDARAVMDRLDNCCGPDGWACNYTAGAGAFIVCNLGVRMPETGEWVWKADGAGATDVEGEKGMLSDALKRAGVRWGIARYLYDLESPWVELEPPRSNGKAGPMKGSERKRLDEVHDKAAQRVGWGGPASVAAYRLLNKVVQDTVTQASDAENFREKHKGMIPMLRVGMRRHLEQTLDRVGTTQAAE